MAKPRVIIIGGGLAGLSAGAYAQASGFQTTIVEHNLALGGVCTAWSRGPYTIDGCIHWLTGGPFDDIYRELGILPKVALHTLELFASYRNLKSAITVDLTRDLDSLVRALIEIAPGDAAEIRRIGEGAHEITELHPPIDQPPELSTLRDSLRTLWKMRGELGTIAHFRKPLGEWANDHLESPELRRLLLTVMAPEIPALFLLMVLGYLNRGWLSRPVGGTARFRDVLIDNYHALGGEARLHATVDEISVAADRACGVRLADGTLLDADYVVSTSSAPETVLRLLSGRYGAEDVRQRIATWRLLDPVVLVSFGVAAPLSAVPQTLLIDGIDPFDVGGEINDHLYLRIYNDDPSVAPPGHTVVQAMLPSNYDWWARAGTHYMTQKDAVAERIRARVEQHIPDMKGRVEVTDISTPLTFWNMARSWRGAYEGWIPSPDELYTHIDKTLPGLGNFYMAGQWVEPGGGVPMAVMSGRHVVQLLCADSGQRFTAPFA